jgi:glycosyltransferase involved in cell wall biosynthesis
MERVAVVRSWYLPLSETFIYNELTQLKHYQAHVLAKKLMNTERFPFPSVQLYEKENDLKAKLRQINPRLIHVHYGATAVELVELKKKLGLPMLTSFHGFDNPANKKMAPRYRDNRLKALFKHGERFTVPSKHMKKILIKHGCPEHKIHVYYSGIDLARFPFIPRSMPAKGKIIILSVGRLVEKKGMLTLIKAFAKIQNDFPHTQLKIIGDGPQEKKLEEEVKSLKLSKKVKLLGELPHDKVIEELKKAHLFCLASQTDKTGNMEGIPNVLKEAMASGVPTISTKHGGIPELISHRHSGLLAKEGSVKSLADQLSYALRHPEIWNRLTRRARARIEKSFNRKNQVIELEKQYADLFNPKRKE